MHTAYIHTTPYPLPSKWGDLNARQLHWIAWLQRTPRHGVALTKLFFFILTLSLPFWKRIQMQWFYIVQATTDERGDLLMLVESFYTDRSFTSQKLPFIKLKTHKLWYHFVLLQGPDDRLANSTFWEFIQAEKHYLAHISSSVSAPVRRGGRSEERTTARPDPSGRQSQHLDSMIAVLYRQLDPTKQADRDADCRTPLTDAGTRYRANLISKLPFEDKLIILLYFEGCRNFIIRAFPRIFPKPPVTESGDSPPSGEAGGGRRGSATAGWIDLISELAPGMTDYESIGNTNLYTALTDITKRIKKNEEAKRRAASTSKRKR